MVAAILNTFTTQLQLFQNKFSRRHHLSIVSCHRCLLMVNFVRQAESKEAVGLTFDDDDERISTGLKNDRLIHEIRQKIAQVRRLRLPPLP